MIDRRTTLVCAALIALMLVGTVCALTLDGSTARALPHGASLLLLFAFPAASAVVVGALYWDGPRASADDAKVRPWRKWGKALSISYCGGLLLLQGVLVVTTLGFPVPLDLAALARTLGVLMTIVSILAINQLPKLPWFERRFAPGGALGPIYGPRYMRLQSRILIVFMIAVMIYANVAAPGTGWRSDVCIILVGAALLVVWSIAWQRHLGRKWKLEQMETGGAKP